MRVLLVGLGLLGLLNAQNPHATAADVTAGGKMFRSHCAPCHGTSGEGGQGPNLTTGVFYHGSTDVALLNNISNGILGTAMPAVYFDTDQVWQIVAYVRSLSRNPSTVKPKGDTTRGEALFKRNNCTGCHMVNGEGGERGPNLSVVGSQRAVDHLRQSILDPNAEVAPQYLVARITLATGALTGFVMNQDTYMVQLLDFSKGLQVVDRKNIRDFSVAKTSSMPSFKGRLSDAELDDVVAYLWSLKRQRSAQ